jgi:hypothetical protein
MLMWNSDVDMKLTDCDVRRDRQEGWHTTADVEMADLCIGRWFACILALESLISRDTLVLQNAVPFGQ